MAAKARTPEDGRSSPDPRPYDPLRPTPSRKKRPAKKAAKKAAPKKKGAKKAAKKSAKRVLRTRIAKKLTVEKSTSAGVVKTTKEFTVEKTLLGRKPSVKKKPSRRLSKRKQV
jgi:hypothetical protein